MYKNHICLHYEHTCLINEILQQTPKGRGAVLCCDRAELVVLLSFLRSGVTILSDSLLSEP